MDELAIQKGHRYATVIPDDPNFGERRRSREAGDAPPIEELQDVGSELRRITAQRVTGREVEPCAAV